MGLKSKFKVLIRAYSTVMPRKDVPVLIIKCLKDGGIKELRREIVHRSIQVQESQKVGKTIYEIQQEIPNELSRDKHKILVIVCVNNPEADITGTICSIENQTFPADKWYILAPEGYICDCENRLIYYTQSMANKLNEILLAEKECDYFFLINEGNDIAPNALNMFHKSIECSGTAIYYSDECIFEATTKKIIHTFVKPDYSPIDLCFSPYLQQCILFPVDMLTKIGKFSEKDYPFSNLISSYIYKCAANMEKVHHVEQILLLRNNCTETEDRFETAIEMKKYLINQGLEASVRLKDFGYSIYFSGISPLVSIVIPTDDYEMCLKCINSILWTTRYSRYEVIIVSTSPICERLTKQLCNHLKIIFVSYNEPYCYSRKANLGAKAAHGEILLFLHDYVIVNNSDWLENLINGFALRQIGGISPKILRMDGTVRYAGIISGGFGFFPIPFNGEKDILQKDFNEITFIPHSVSVLSATCLAVRADVFNRIGGFDEENLSEKFSNAVLSVELMRRGYTCLYQSESIIYSDGGNWYDSWFEHDNSTAYTYLLMHYIEYLEHDPYFTESMKKKMLKNLPIDTRFFAGTQSKGKKKILLITHELSMTGAPIALMNAAMALMENGDYPLILSPFDGPLRVELLKRGIAVLIDNTINGNAYWTKYASNFDAVVVNTLSEYHVIKPLEMLGIPTIWWVHESRASYVLGADAVIPYNIAKNIHVFCAGKYAQKMLREFRPDYISEILLYGLPDISSEPKGNYSLENPQGKLVFLSIGTHEYRKGQDILVEAIKQLPEQIKEKCIFYFFGKKVDDNIHNTVMAFSKSNPKLVKTVDHVSRAQMMDVYRQAFCVICSSRDDPMPVFMTEAMMLSKLCICSENAGTYSLIQHQRSGLVYHDNSSAQLSEQIIYAVENSKQMELIAQEGRCIYEQYFSMEKFNKNFTGVINSL